MTDKWTLIGQITYFLCLMVQKSNMLIIRPNSCNEKALLWLTGFDKNGIWAYLEECYDDGNNADDVKFTDH